METNHAWPVASPSQLFDVAIVGSGPVGASLANLLGRRGLKVALIDRNAGVMQIPRAVHLDGETMRAFQNMGLQQEIIAICRPGHGMRWVDSRGETLLMRTGHEGIGPQGWHNDYYFHQPVLEQALRDGLNRYTNVQLFERVEVKGYREGDDRVRLLLEAQDGPSGELWLDCRYVVGCDGARSTVRAWIGEEHEDLGEHQAWLVVDAVLHHPLPLPEHTVQHCDPRRPATSIYVNPLRRRWEIMLLPGDDSHRVTQPETVWRLLSPWIKPAQGRLERAATYTFHSLIARRWQVGRLLIAGDAAHQTPPFLGQGLCAGVRDVVNLAWKLDRAIRHPDSARGLIETYGPERIPHAREFVALAVDVGKVIQELDPDLAAARDGRLKAQGLQFAFPEPLLGCGVHRPGHLASGKIFMQPMLADGRWLDELATGRVAIVLRDAERLPPLPDGLDDSNCLVVTNADQAAQAWMAEQGAVGVILRPDGYVFDVCGSYVQLEEALLELKAWLVDGTASTCVLTTQPMNPIHSKETA